MRKYFVAIALTAMAGGAFVNGAGAQDARFAVVHVSNETKSEMSFYHTWVWNSGRVERGWSLIKIGPGQTRTVHYSYDGPDRKSPDLIVVFDSDRNSGARWEKVKLARAAAPTPNDRSKGFTYALRYDDPRQEYASLYATNGGTVTVLDRKAAPPRVN